MPSVLGIAVRSALYRKDHMGKKHYEAIAAAIKEQVDDVRNSHALDALRLLAERLSREFWVDNSRFNSKQFMAACGF